MDNNNNDLIAPITPEEVFAAHRGGKLSIKSSRPLTSKRDLSIAYSPGVAEACLAIKEDPARARELTGISRTVAVVSDGSAVLGLGNIGPHAALPVMEGKCQLFTTFADLNAIPIVLDVHSADEIVAAVTAIAPSVGAINLEDIAAPICFEVEQRLEESLNIPVFHDDQHGTAVVVTAGLANACRVTGRNLEDLRVVVSGAGAAGVACTRMLLESGVKDIVVLDSRGIVSQGRENLNPVKEKIAEVTNPRGLTGGPAEAFTGADAFIGVSRGHVGEELLQLMAPEPILFSLANPDPEIPVELANKYGSVVATGRSDLPNQVNNVLAFPGIFAGALAAGATHIAPAMKLAASKAIAACVGDDLAADFIMPSPLDPKVEPAVSKAVQEAARKEG
ncbi:NAD(P)-dependent malic enzyme [Corynebacterium lubricantis]|uniref:NAD(P)-dependent malic enzyme n=1 Tax=Corynebacterium lubricantis TaxID=541095 RepID=UPI000365E808|nr:NADP-dependent malic enzyme [Corynebacterium lubricantis]